jgi:hypothetical protein
MLHIKEIHWAKHMQNKEKTGKSDENKNKAGNKGYKTKRKSVHTTFTVFLHSVLLFALFEMVSGHQQHSTHQISGRHAGRSFHLLVPIGRLDNVITVRAIRCHGQVITVHTKSTIMIVHGLERGHIGCTFDDIVDPFDASHHLVSGNERISQYIDLSRSHKTWINSFSLIDNLLRPICFDMVLRKCENQISVGRALTLCSLLILANFLNGISMAPKSYNFINRHSFVAIILIHLILSARRWRSGHKS